MAKKPIENQKTQESSRSKLFRPKRNIMWIFFGFSVLIFSTSLFKNIQYPLFWADESMTVVGAQRVLAFGYPKVHDGKNVFYDLRHTNPKLGIDEATDAYVGGTGWGHYYFGALAVKFADGVDDIYSKTGIIRTFFAILGLVGLLLFVWLVSSIFKDNSIRLLMGTLFFILCSFSVSLALLMREARYYSICIFLVSVIIGLYVKFRFGGGINQWVYTFLSFVALTCMFFTFAPLFFILIVGLGVFELIQISQYFMQKKELKTILFAALPVVVFVLISLIVIYPFLSYFKTFEISEAMATFNRYNSKMFNENVSTTFKYFKNFELLWLALIMKVLFFIFYKSILKSSPKAVILSTAFFIFFIVYTYLIARIPNFIYTRYIIMFQPILVMSILIDLFYLVFEVKSEKTYLTSKYWLFASVFLVLTAIGVFSNKKYISGHLKELIETYKGPLDYTIPAIIAKYKRTDTLTIAANYEETSYMYYLNAKVVVGFIGNNLDEDAKANPHVIAYRKPWGNFGEIFQGYFSRFQYVSKAFSCYDNPVNNIPELNFMPAFNHQFSSKLAQSQQEATELYFRK